MVHKNNHNHSDKNKFNMFNLSTSTKSNADPCSSRAQSRHVSLSGLVAIRNYQLETVHVQKFIINYCQLVNAGNSITLIWTPGHTGIRGNELADEASVSQATSVSVITKSSSQLNSLNYEVPSLGFHSRAHHALS